MNDCDRHSVKGEAAFASPNIISSDWIDESIDDVLYVWNERMHPLYKDSFASRMETTRQMAHKFSSGAVYVVDPGQSKENAGAILDMEIPLPIDMMMKRVFGVNWIQDERIYRRFRRRYLEGRYNQK